MSLSWMRCTSGMYGERSGMFLAALRRSVAGCSFTVGRVPNFSTERLALLAVATSARTTSAGDVIVVEQMDELRHDQKAIQRSLLP